MRFHPKQIIALIALIFVFLGGAIFFSLSNKQSSGLLFQKNYPSLDDLVLRDMHGNTITAASLHGRFVVFDLWTSWCLFCEKHLADLRSIQKEHGNLFTIVEVNRGESLEAVRRYSESEGLILQSSDFNSSEASSTPGAFSTHTAKDSLFFVLDANDSFYQTIQGFLMPETIFVDKQGRIVDHVRGLINIIELRRHIEDAFGF